MKIEKDFSFKEGNPDCIFNYLLQANYLVRVKRENSMYQIVVKKDIK